MNAPNEFDFWYAINNTRMVVPPGRRLETFGATLLQYHLVSEDPDAVDKIKVRIGRIQAQRPQIITPSALPAGLLEGFGEAAERYLEWLREHESDIHLLRYGFVIKKEEISEETVTDTLEAVVDRVAQAVRRRDDPFSAVLVGVDSPWEVCLLKMMVDVIGQSLPGNVRELQRRNLFSRPEVGVGQSRQDLEADFHAAARDPALIDALGKKLIKQGCFSEYEDRFFALLKARRANKA
jgi:hypothetical protein